MAADGAVSFLLHKIDFFISREWQLLSEIDEEVDGLKHEFESIRALLIDADAREEKNQQVVVWIRKVRELAYDIEDVLDMHAFHIARRTNQFSVLIKGGLGWLTQLTKSHSIGTLIRDINVKLQSVKETKERYSLISSSEASSSSFEHHSYLYPRVACLYLEEEDVIGLDEPRDELISWATKGEAKLQVIFVEGMAGSGKTTLVKKVYEKIKGGFSCSAWITISKSEKKEKLLWTMLKRLFDSSQDQIPRDFYTTNPVQLMDKIRHYLQERKYLIVLDDLWSRDVWESIKYVLPSQCHGRIVITTRRGDIAYFCSGKSAVVYNQRPLPLEKARQLLHSKAFPSGGECPPGLIYWSNMILERCEGLPLAIVAIGSILSKTGTTADAWKKIHDSLASELESDGLLSSILKVLSISYDDLPYYLKYCCLYFCNFPESYPIKCRRLIRLWIAEGLVKEAIGKTLEEVGEDYLKELIHRNIVQVGKVDIEGKAKTCKVHYLLHKIILAKAEEEVFCRVSKDSGIGLNQKIRRLSVHGTYNNMSGKVFPVARTLFMFTETKVPSPRPGSIFSAFSILKVLDLEDSPLETFPTEITNLVLLRYLSLRNSNIRRLPKSVGKLQNLETLDLRQTFITELPNEILKKLGKLRLLLIYRCSRKNYASPKCLQGFKVSANIGRLENLHDLSLIIAEKNVTMIQALGNLTKLRKLGVVDLEEENGFHLSQSIEKMTDLRSLDVAAIREDEVLDLSGIYDPPPLLRHLHLKGCLNKLPDWISALHDLVRLRLKWSRLNSKSMTVLQDLPNLQELELLDAYTEKRLVFHPNKFCKLRILALKLMSSLRSVNIAESSLPCLKVLILEQCENLEKVPGGIDKLACLEEFHLYGMPRSLVEGLEKNGGKFNRLVQHIPLVCSYSLLSTGNWHPKDLSK